MTFRIKYVTNYSNDAVVTKGSTVHDWKRDILTTLENMNIICRHFFCVKISVNLNVYVAHCFLKFWKAGIKIGLFGKLKMLNVSGNSLPVGFE